MVIFFHIHNWEYTNVGHIQVYIQLLEPDPTSLHRPKTGHELDLIILHGPRFKSGKKLKLMSLMSFLQDSSCRFMYVLRS
jgi:hypothetical protein